MQIKITVIEDQKQAVSTEFVEVSAAIDYLAAFATPSEEAMTQPEESEELEDSTVEENTDVIPSPESASSSQQGTTQDGVGSANGAITEKATELSPTEAKG